MLHGSVELGNGDFRYSFTTDNGEGGPNSKDTVPFGYDFRYSFNEGNYLVGLSGYSSNGETTSDIDLGDGSPRSGVLPWMASDDFDVYSVFGEFHHEALVLQLAYTRADHDATRDAEAVVQVVNNAGIHQFQRERFLIDGSGPVNVANVDTDGKYDVTTWYIRAAYSFYKGASEIQPYIQWDNYENPETIKNKDWGGDGEAGLADDGEFSKSTLGIIYRPTPNLAFKFDTSTHFQDVNGKSENYSEVRFDVSFIFGR